MEIRHQLGDYVRVGIELRYFPTFQAQLEPGRLSIVGYVSNIFPGHLNYLRHSQVPDRNQEEFDLCIPN